MNYPNPFSGNTTITYHLECSGPANLELYNFRGMKIQTLADGFQQPGDHEIEWSGSRQGCSEPGIYLLKLTTAAGIITRKMVLLK